MSHLSGKLACIVAQILLTNEQSMDTMNVNMTVASPQSVTERPVFRQRMRDETALGLANASFEVENRPPILTRGGQYYRSYAEESIGCELASRQGVVFTANAKVTVAGGGCIEADFLVWVGGKCGVLEVNGPHHADPMDSHRRARQFQRQGFAVFQFFSADECMHTPHLVVDDFLRILDTSR